MSLFSKQIDRRIAAYQRELIETHYKEVENMYRQIRGWRHDYRNHIQLMKVLASNGDMDGIKAYLDELDTDLNTVDTVVKTGNAMADAILNSKISLAQSRGITVQCDAHIPVQLKTSEIDLCCIIGNLFDNAIEASQKLPLDQRLIRVYMDMKNTQLYISFTNFTAAGKLQKVGKLFATSKGEGHGFGLVLDEPTAALDPIAEAEIYSKFNDITGDKTAIYISHRLSSCKFCDEIAVFHEGEVVQQGSHDALVADKNGKYYELWNAQAQYYTEKTA